MKSFPEHNISGNFYQGMKTENFDMPSLTSLSMSPVAMAQLQQMQKVPSASQMNLVRSQLREHVSGGHGAAAADAEGSVRFPDELGAQPIARAGSSNQHKRGRPTTAAAAATAAAGNDAGTWLASQPYLLP